LCSSLCCWLCRRTRLFRRHLSIHPQPDLHPIAKLQTRVSQGSHQLGALGFDQHTDVRRVEPELTKQNLMCKL
jgi:hypothetical protein